MAKLKLRKRKKIPIENLKVKDKRKRINGSVGGDVCIFVFLILLGVFMIFPIYYSVIQSLKPVEELFVFPPKLYVLNPTTKNFSDMIKVAAEYIVPLSRYVFNSFFTTIVICVANVFVTCMAAFVLAKCKFPGDRLLNKIIVIALLFQSQATYIMQFLVYSKLHWIDTYWVLIIPYIATAMNLYLMRQSMSTIHDAMIEAAKVDGADLFRICWQVVVPNQKPAIMTIIIFAFQQAWNLNGGAVIYSEEYKTLPTIVQQISLAGLARQGVTFASAVLLLIPPLVVFLVAQSNVMETMANSGMKD